MTPHARLKRGPGRMLTIHVGESDQWNGLPVYEAVVRKAHEQHMAGATVLRGPMGFGIGSRIHTAKILRLSEDLPFVVQVVDTPANIDAFLGVLAEIADRVLMTVHDVDIVAAPEEAAAE